MHRLCGIVIFALILGAQVSSAQIWDGIKKTLDKADKVADKFRDLEITESEEIQLGQDISARIRSRYGVVQDPEIHRYVTLVGTVVKEKCSRPGLAYQFIVLDTDGVNAFAAPGGFIHITRGALSLMKNEAELAGVLAHEIAHVTGKHTLKAIQKGKLVQMAANEKSVSSSPALFKRLADETYKAVLAGFSREDELDADLNGLRTAAQTGYDASGLSLFLAALKQRNAGNQEKQGLFDSHPETDERVQKLNALAQANNWNGGVVARERFAGKVKYQPVDPANIATPEAGASGLTGSSNAGAATEDASKKKSRFSLSNIKNPLSSKTSSNTSQSAEVTGSGGSRGVDREQEAKGGSNSSLVPVVISAADVLQFKKDVNLKI
jgi:Zn-dependent protease with chaperone function